MLLRYFICIAFLSASRSFQIATTGQHKQRLPSSRGLVVLRTANEGNQGVTPNQVKALRKELSKRAARRSLALVKYVEDDGDFLPQVCQFLEDHELVQVRSVSPKSKRKVFEKAEQLTYDLNNEMGREVTMVDMQGHAVSFYAPSSDEEKRKIILRSSYQENAWEKRPKQLRDHRGQIIKD
jgi:RNA-binding protein YhbY